MNNQIFLHVYGKTKKVSLSERKDNNTFGGNPVHLEWINGLNYYAFDFMYYSFHSGYAYAKYLRYKRNQRTHNYRFKTAPTDVVIKFK